MALPIIGNKYAPQLHLVAIIWYFPHSHILPAENISREHPILENEFTCSVHCMQCLVGIYIIEHCLVLSWSASPLKIKKYCVQDMPKDVNTFVEGFCSISYGFRDFLDSWWLCSVWIVTGSNGFSKLQSVLRKEDKACNQFITVSTLEFSG